MTYVSKPGDTAAAKAIGTYPEIPDILDTPDRDSQWWRQDYFDVGPDHQHVMVVGGPKGVAVVSHDGHFYSVVKDGVVVFETCVRYRCSSHPHERVTRQLVTS